MLATITNITIKPPSEKSSGSAVKLTGSVSENILPDGKDSASDPQKPGRVTFQIQGGLTFGLDCKMKARYKVGEGSGATEITWTLKLDEPLDPARASQFCRDVCGEQLYTVSFKERDK